MMNFRRICCFGGQILTFYVKQGSIRVESVFGFTKHEFDVENICFGRVNEQISVNIAHGNSHGHIFAVGECLEKDSGLYKTHVLLGSMTDSVFFTYNTDGSSKLKSVGKYRLSLRSSDIKSLGKAKLFDGGGACFCSNAGLYILYDGFFRTYPINSDGHNEIFDCFVSGDFLIISGKFDQDDSYSITAYCISLTKLELIQNCSTQLVPDFYASILTFVKIINVDITSLSERLHEPKFTTDVLVSTSCGQLLVCHDGQLVSCVTLPFKDGCNIFRMTCSERSLVAVLSSCGLSCVVDCNKSQVMYVLEAVDSILIDDFVGRGSNQFLFLPPEKEHDDSKDVVSMLDEPDNRDIISRFLLTDFNGILYDRWPFKEQYSVQLKGSSSGGHHQGAVDALKARRLTGRAMVNEAHRLRVKKLTVIEETRDAVKRMTLGESVPLGSRNTLVSLVQSQQSTTDHLPTISSHSIQEAVTTTELWQRILDKSFVVGVDIHNNTQRAVLSVRLSLVRVGGVQVGKEEMKSCSRCFRCRPSQSSTAASLPKRTRTEPYEFERFVCRTTMEDARCIPPTGSATVLVSCDLPPFLLSEVQSFHVILEWEEETRTTEDGLEMTCSHPIGFSRVIGKATVDVEGVVCGRWKPVFSCSPSVLGDHQKEAIAMVARTNDLLTLHAVQIQQRVNISWSRCGPSVFFSALTSTLGLSYSEAPLQCFICLDAQSPLFLSRLVILEARQSILRAEFFVRDLCQWTLLLRTLFKVLPVDIQATAVADGETTTLAESALVRLRQELLRRDDAEQEPAPHFSKKMGDANQIQDVDNVRSEFELRRKRISECCAAVKEGNQKGAFLTKVLEDQQKTDGQFWHLAEALRSHN